MVALATQTLLVVKHKFQCWKALSKSGALALLEPKGICVPWSYTASHWKPSLSLGLWWSSLKPNGLLIYGSKLIHHPLFFCLLVSLYGNSWIFQWGFSFCFIFGISWQSATMRNQQKHCHWHLPLLLHRICNFIIFNKGQCCCPFKPILYLQWHWNQKEEFNKLIL